MNDFLSGLVLPFATAWGMPLSRGDVLGFVTGLLCVLLTARGSIWNFPLGIANSLILGVVFFQLRLFADASLQVMFIALSAWGWWKWTQQGEVREQTPSKPTTTIEQLIYAASAAALTGVLWAILVKVKGSFPPVDALITSLSVFAQIQLNRKQVSSWWWWIAVDLISIPLYWHRGIPLIAALYVIFLFICIYGLWHWRALQRPSVDQERGIFS